MAGYPEVIMGERYSHAALVGTLLTALFVAACGDSGTEGEDGAGPRAGCVQACQQCGLSEYGECLDACEVEGPTSSELPDCSVEPGPIDPIDPVDPTQIQDCLSACNACDEVPSEAPFTSSCIFACQRGTQKAEDVACPIAIPAPCWNGFQANQTCWDGKVRRQSAVDGFDYWWTLEEPVVFDPQTDRVELCTSLEVRGGQIAQTLSGCTAVDPASYQVSQDSTLRAVRVGSYDAALDGDWHEWLYVHGR